jgi:hypothetical protein
MARRKSKREKVRFNLNLYKDQVDKLRMMEELDDVTIAVRIRGWIDEKIIQANLNDEEVIIGGTEFDII